MAGDSIAIKYVNALADVAELSDLKEIEKGLADFVAAYDASSQLKQAIQNPAISLGDRLLVVEELVGRMSNSDKLKNLAKLLVVNDRVELASELLSELRLRIIQIEKSKAVEIVSARNLSASDRAEYEATLAKSVGRDCRITWVVDPSLLGGVQIKVGDSLLDRSVAGALDRAERELLMN